MLSKTLAMRWLVVLSVFIGLGFGSSTPAHADEFSDAVQALNADNNTDKAAAIEALSATGDERAATVLSALLNGTLFYRQSDGLVVLSKESGNVTILIDPSTMNEVADVSGSEAKKIRINNKLRGQLKGVLGALTLLSKDADKRQNAADEVFKANDPSMLPVLQKAIARESDPDVKGRMLRAQAAIILEYSEDTAARLKAAQTLGEFTDPDISALLGKIANTSTDPEVKKLAKDMQDSVEGRLAAWSFLGNLFQGVSLGSVLLLAAVGLAITFGVMGVINMAHGEMVMLGAYTTFMVQDVIRTHFPAAFDWSLAIAVPAAFLVTGAVGILVERGIIRWLYGRPLETLLATWGLSLMLQQLIRTLFGPTNQEVGNPSWMSGAIETSTGLVLTYNRIWIIVFSLAVLGMLALVTRKTMFGLQMRAVTQNRAMANSMGIRSGWVDALTFALGSGIAGMAGVALSQIDNVSPNLGQTYIIDSFMVVVFGGVGNLWGTLVGAFSLGIVNKFLEPYAGAVLGKIFVLVGIILFIQKRPRGLFALKGRSVEG
ncbi:urea ABC transporter permease subunit UrtB [Magnetovibrio blakemorei]|nr:urea ABC transporter permease subunit UrtB [Magnetovibrio blakemorei]